jgi:hypothetical protein
MKNMKYIIIIVSVILFITAISLSNKRKASEQKRREQYLELRNAIINRDLNSVNDTVGEADVYCILMEMGFEKGTITLMASVFGDASLYYETGGGVLGGIGHETVRKAASEMNVEANKFITQCSPVNIFPLPERDHVVFYIITKKGVFSMQFSINELEQKKNPFWPLYYAGQEVITQLRLVTEKMRPSNQ